MMALQLTFGRDWAVHVSVQDHDQASITRHPDLELKNTTLQVPFRYLKYHTYT